MTEVARPPESWRAGSVPVKVALAVISKTSCVALVTQNPFLTCGTLKKMSAFEERTYRSFRETSGRFREFGSFNYGIKIQKY